MTSTPASGTAAGELSADEKFALKQAFRDVVKRKFEYEQCSTLEEVKDIAKLEIATYQWTPILVQRHSTALYEVLLEFGCEVDLLGSLLLQLELEGVTMTPRVKTSLRRLGGSIVALAEEGTAPVQLSLYPAAVGAILAFAEVNPETLRRTREIPCHWTHIHTDYLVDICAKAGEPAFLIENNSLQFRDGSTIDQRDLHSLLAQTCAHLIRNTGRAAVAAETGASARAIALSETLSIRACSGMNVMFDGRLFSTLASLCTSTITVTLYHAIFDASAYTVVVRGNQILPVLYMRRAW